MGSLLSVRVKHRLSAVFTLEAELEAPAGFTMVLGPSGCGKSSLLNCIAGLIRPNSGRIVLNSRVLFDSSCHTEVPVAQRRLGYVFQNLALFPHLTVTQNVQYGLAKLSAGERRERAMAMLETFRIAHLVNRKPRQISGGERQRVALARALVTDPAMLMLDEPLAALDIATKSRILDDLRKWNAVRGIPILYVTHSPAEAFAVGEAVVAMGSGRILAQGTPQEVLIAPRHESIAQIVGFENVFEAAVQSIEEAQGTMICELAGSRTLLEVPLSDVAPGDAVRIAIRAGDIILAVEQPGRMSARNCIAGQLTSIGREGVKVIANVAAGATFEVHLTPASAVALDLKVGSPVWMIIKTYSCNLVRGGRGASETLGDEPDRG